MLIQNFVLKIRLLHIELSLLIRCYIPLFIVFNGVNIGGTRVYSIMKSVIEHKYMYTQYDYLCLFQMHVFHDKTEEILFILVV